MWGRAASLPSKLPGGSTAPALSQRCFGDPSIPYAFISHSSDDRDEVLSRVQMLSISGIDYFQDVITLEPGDRWHRKVEAWIDQCDLFLLFWSKHAKESRWVRQEVEYALARQGADELAAPEIRPVIVEPWKELSHLHFDDRVLYFMRRPNDS